MDIIKSNAPGVYSYTRVQAQAVASAPIITVGVVFESEKGPTDAPVLITSGSRDLFIKTFGAPKPNVSPAHEGILELLKTEASVYALRVANEASHSGLSIFSTSDYNEGIDSESFKRFLPHLTLTQPLGTDGKGINDLTAPVVVLEINGVSEDDEADYVLAVSFSGDGGAVREVETAAGANIAASLANFVDDIADALEDVGYDATVTLLSETVSGTRFIVIKSAPGTDLPAFFGLDNGLPEEDGNYARVHLRPVMFEVFASSPGVHGDRIGIRIRDVDYGRSCTKSLTINNMTPTSTITVSVDGVSVGPVTTSGTDQANMDAITSALKTALVPLGYLIKVGEQSWEKALSPSPESASATDRTIYIRSPNFGQDMDLSFVGTNSLTAAVSTIVPAAPYTGLFSLEVFLKDSPNSPVEVHRVTLHESIDEFGNQTNISYVVNEGPARSGYIRIRQPEYSMYAQTDNQHLMRMKGFWADETRSKYHVHSSIQYLQGGDNGNALTPEDFMAGIEKFRDRERYPISLFMNAGLTDRNIQKKIAEVVEARQDVVGILDMPSNMQEVNLAKEYVDYSLGIDSTSMAIYSPDIRVVSEFAPGGRFIPPSADVCARIANRAAMITNPGAPAGVEMGNLPRVNKTRVEYSFPGDVDALLGSNVNPIILKLNRGYNIWGARTMGRTSGPLSFLSISLDLKMIQRQMISILDQGVFRSNTPTNRFGIKQRINALLSSYRRSEVIDYFETTIDEKNNFDYHAANGQMNIDVILRFVYPAEKIRLITTVTDTIITFQELQAA